MANEQWAGAVHPSISIGSKYSAEIERLMPSGVTRTEDWSARANDAAPETARCATGDSAFESAGEGSVSTTTASLLVPQPQPAANIEATATAATPAVVRFDHTIPGPPCFLSSVALRSEPRPAGRFGQRGAG